MVFSRYIKNKTMKKNGLGTKRKIRVGIIFGGKSAEHEVSLMSAKNVVAALDKDKYEAVLIGIDKTGKWFLNQGASFLLNEANPKLIALNKEGRELGVAPGETSQLVSLDQHHITRRLDVVFPVLHGTYGEDGTMQGLLKLLDVPFVGPSVLGSAVGMDKDVAKRLLKEAGIPTARCVVLHSHNRRDIHFGKIKKQLGLPLFVKPANLGSSVGIHKVKTEKEFMPAVNDAFLYDNKILVEEFIDGREVEVAVLGNEYPRASIPGEVIPHHEFYSYEAKYIDENGAGLEIPAKLPKPLIKKIQELAVKTFQVLGCGGMSRVDFFVTKRGALYINEVNTIPGFTKISMYPKMWEASGLGYTELIDRLLELAIERYVREKKLKTTF